MSTTLTGTFSAVNNVSANIFIPVNGRVSITLARTGGSAWAVCLDNVIGTSAVVPLVTYTSAQTATLYYANFGQALLLRLRCCIVSGGDTIAYTLSSTAQAELSGEMAVRVLAGVPSPSAAAGQVENGWTLDQIAAFLASGETITFNRVTVTHAMTPYAVTATDYAMSVTTAAGVVTVTLPASPTNGRMLRVGKTSSDSTAVTVDGNGNTVNGSSTLVFTVPKTDVILQYNSTTTNWEIC